MGVEEGEKVQTKGIDNLFNRIIVGNFFNLERELPRCRKPTEHPANSANKETTLGTS
jgi:hypothetical protein